MSQEWYYSIDGGREGPVASSELKKLADAGKLKPTDLVWKDGMAEWTAAKTIKGLFSGGSSGSSEKPASASSGGIGAAAAAKMDAARGDRRRDEDEDDDRPRRRRDEDDDRDRDEDRPRSRSRRDDDDRDDDDDRPRRRRRDEEDDYDDDPRRRRGPRMSRQEISSKKMTAGILALLLGGWGVHKFYLGMSGAGAIQIVLSLVTCGLGGIIAFVEGIIYLTKSEEDFYQLYIVEQKAWF